MRLYLGITLSIILFALSVPGQGYAQMSGQEPESQQHPEASLLARIVAEAAGQEAKAGRYAYIRHMKVDSEDEVLDRVERFDPARPEGGRWTLLETGGQEPTADQLADYDKNDKDRDSNVLEIYQDVIGDLDPAEAVLLEETETEAVYRLLNVNTDFLSMESDDLSKHLQARLTVDKTGPAPFASSLRIFVTEPVSKGMMAKINAFETAFSFMRHDRTGEVLPQEIRVEVSVKALVFISVDALTSIKYSGFEVRGD